MSDSASPPPAVFIAAISSDIGRALALMYRARGWRVIGTYRERAAVEPLTEDPSISLIRCDITRKSDLEAVARDMTELNASWDLFISAVGQLAPIGNFFDLDRDEWLHSADLNGCAQLALLHTIRHFRRTRPYARVAFLVGGAINRAFARYSAYSLAKISLVKFCELIHEECSDVHAVAIGTGWVATRIHLQTIAAAESAGDNLERTSRFLSIPGQGTSVADILGCIDWCFAQQRDMTGGRNFSVVHDLWRDGGAMLVEQLRRDPDKFKLRRYANSEVSPDTSA